MIDQAKVDEAVETLLKAEAIKADAELMKEVAPALQKKHEAGKGLQSLWKKGLKSAQEAEGKEKEKLGMNEGKEILKEMKED